MDCETYNYLPALEQVFIDGPSNIYSETFSKTS